MRISVLKEFLYLASSLSFTKTARKFHMTQPTISKHISSLEDDLGFDLLVRGKKSVELTPAGKVFAKEVGKSLPLFDKAIAKAQEASKENSGVVEVAFLSALCRSFLPQFNRSFSRSSPNIKAHYTALDMDSYLEALANESADVFISGHNVPIPKGFKSQIIHESPFCLAMHKNHRLAKKKFVALDDLKRLTIHHIDTNSVPDFEELMGNFLEPVQSHITLKEDVMEMDDWTLMLSDAKTVGLSSAISGDYFGNDIIYVPFSPDVPNVPKIKICAIWREEDKRGAINQFLESLFSFDDYPD